MGIISCNPEVKMMTTIHLPKNEFIWENAVRKNPSLSTQLKNSVNFVISVLPCSYDGGKLFTSMEKNNILIEFNRGPIFLYLYPQNDFMNYISNITNKLI